MYVHLPVQVQGTLQVQMPNQQPLDNKHRRDKQTSACTSVQAQKHIYVQVLQVQVQVQVLKQVQVQVHVQVQVQVTM